MADRRERARGLTMGAMRVGDESDEAVETQPGERTGRRWRTVALAVALIVALVIGTVIVLRATRHTEARATAVSEGLLDTVPVGPSWTLRNHLTRGTDRLRQLLGADDD